MAHKSETETIITWTSGDERAEVYSLMPRIWSMCLRAGGEEIKPESGIRDGKKVARTFLVPIESVRIRKKRQMTQKQLDRARERGRALAASRLGLSAKGNGR